MMKRMQVGVSTMQNETEITYLIIMDERDTAVLLHCKQGIKYKSDVNSVTAHWHSLSSARTSNTVSFYWLYTRKTGFTTFLGTKCCVLFRHIIVKLIQPKTRFLTS